MDRTSQSARFMSSAELLCPGSDNAGGCAGTRTKIDPHISAIGARTSLVLSGLRNFIMPAILLPASDVGRLDRLVYFQSTVKVQSI